MLKKIVTLALSAVALASVPFSVHAAGEKKVDIAASAPGGTWFVGLGAYAKVLSSRYPQYDTTLFSGGGVANVVRVSRGQSAIGITAVTFMKAAAEGTDPFKTPVRVMALANLDDDTRVCFVVPANSRLTSVRQIVEEKKPLRLFQGSKVGGNAEVFFRWVMESLGATKKQMQEWGCTLYGGTPNEAGSMMKEGQIDVLSLTNPGEHFMLTELIKNMDVRFLPLDERALAHLRERRAMTPGVITTDMYQPAVTEDVPVIAAPSGLVVQADVSDEDAYLFAKALVEGRDDIALALPSWSSIRPDRVCKDLPIDIHPGAARYYREIGCLK